MRVDKLEKYLKCNVNKDGRLCVEYDDERYYRSFWDYTIDDMKVFIRELESVLEDAQDQLNWYNSINEVKSK